MAHQKHGNRWELPALNAFRLSMRNAHGIVLCGPKKDGGSWKVCYSGDTRPSRKLIAAGAGSDILIHEATVGGNDVAEARAKGHSTVTEALKAGASMKSKVTVLTHFSQRWQCPPLDEFYDACRTSGLQPWQVGAVVLADDFMKLSVNEAADNARRLDKLKHASYIVTSREQVALSHMHQGC